MKRFGPIKVCVVGAPECGKSQLVLDLASSLKEQGFKARLLADCAESYAERCGNAYAPSHQMMIHLEKEEVEAYAKCHNHDFIITDAPAWYSAIYVQLLASVSYKDEALKDLINSLVKRSMENLYTYDEIFFLPLRDDAPTTAKEIERSMRGFLNFMGAGKVGYHTLPDEQQLAFIQDVLEQGEYLDAKRPDRASH